jgi:hypothetical protein
MMVLEAERRVTFGHHASRIALFEGALYVSWDGPSDVADAHDVHAVFHEDLHERRSQDPLGCRHRDRAHAWDRTRLFALDESSAKRSCIDTDHYRVCTNAR